MLYEWNDILSHLSFIVISEINSIFYSLYFFVAVTLHCEFISTICLLWVDIWVPVWHCYKVAMNMVDIVHMYIGMELMGRGDLFLAVKEYCRILFQRTEVICILSHSIWVFSCPGSSWIIYTNIWSAFFLTVAAVFLFFAFVWYLMWCLFFSSVGHFLKFEIYAHLFHYRLIYAFCILL